MFWGPFFRQVSSLFSVVFLKPQKNMFFHDFIDFWVRPARPGRQKGIPEDHFWDVFGVVFANAGFLVFSCTFAPFFPSILYRFFGSFFCGLRCKSSTGRPLKIAISWCKNNDFEKIAVLENHRARLEISSKKRCQIHSKTAHRTKGEKH